MKPVDSLLRLVDRCSLKIHIQELQLSVHGHHELWGRGGGEKHRCQVIHVHKAHLCTGIIMFLPSIAIAFASNKTQAAKVVMPSPALKPGKQGPLVTFFLTTTLRYGLPGDSARAPAHQFQVDVDQHHRAVGHQAGEAVTVGSNRQLEDAAVGAQGRDRVRDLRGRRVEGARKVRRRRQIGTCPWLQLFLHLCHSV